MRVGVVGVGRIGSFHAATCRGHPGVRAVDAVDPAGVPAALRGLGVAAHDALSPALAARWDAAVVATPTAAHHDTVAALLDAGVPTLCEKPLTLEPRRTALLGGRADRAGVPLRAGYQRRFDGALHALRELVRGRRLGRVLSASSATLDPAPPSAAYLRACGGIFVDMHVHDFDTLAWLLDDPVERVQATGARGDASLAAPPDDHGVTSAALVTAGGVLATVTGSRWSGGGYGVRASVAGTGGEAAVDARGGVVLHDADGAHVLRCPAPRAPAGFAERFAAAYRAEVSAFLDEVAGGVRRCADWRDDAAAVGVALAARDSARTGAALPCPSAAGATA